MPDCGNSGSRSLRRLAARGLIEQRTDKHNRAHVRLSDKDYPGNRRLFDVYRMSD